MLASDTISDVFGILKHPIRRKIVLLLKDGPKRYSDIIKGIDIYTGHLYYHLNAVKILIRKVDGGYELNDLGKKAVELLLAAEDPTNVAKEPVEKTIFAY